MSIYDERQDASPARVVNVVTESQGRSPGSISVETGGVDLTEFFGYSLSVNIEPAIVFTIADKTTIST